MNAITNVVGQSLEDGARVARLKKAVDEATYGGRVRQGGVISAVAVGHRQAALAVMCRG